MVAGGVQEFDLAPSGRPQTVGRSSRAQIQIDSQSVSRRHATLTLAPDQVLLQDDGSTNGTFVNGQRLDREAVAIHVGDALRFGSVVAQLRGGRASRSFSPRVVSADEFDSRVLEEAERCVRFNRSLTTLAIEVTDKDPEAGSRARAMILGHLRSLDVVISRGPCRFDALLAECADNEAMGLAREIHDAFCGRGVTARIGIAAFPSHVPSPDSLLLAAQLAMHSVEGSGVAEAQGGARQIRLGGHEIVVAEPSMIRLFGLVERVAAGRMPALIIGETGSGKEIVASAIHHLGPRAKKPMVNLNCAAVPVDLLESELFGYVRGAFSGAVDDKPGLFEAAEGGSLFLDEIGEMPAALQAKLLRVLEDKVVRRVGATQETTVDVRVIAATHRDLKTAVVEGKFRQDLYYRLGAIQLAVPPLRDRPREIPILAERFAGDAAEQAGRHEVTLGAEAAEALLAYAWPGNVRELRNVMNTAVMMCGGSEIDVSHLPPDVVGGADDETGSHHSTLVMLEEPTLPLEAELREVERRRITQALERSDGNQTRAAELLGIPRRTLVSKLAQLGIETTRQVKARQPES
jgi:DNA-binding NtrC family response regulator